MKKLAWVLALGCTVCLAVPTMAVQTATAHGANGLQLSIITPDPGSIGERVSLDVGFRGAAVEVVELSLDGALVAKRQLSTAQSRGVITFSLDTTLLTEGDHTIQVRASGTDGRIVTSNARIRIPAADLSAPVRIAYPATGTQVAGTVPVRVQLDSDLQRQRPYVTFFVDKELKVLRNYPPYEFAWDTTRVANGWHLLEAWTQTVDAATPLKSRVVHVNVNNPGGETKRQDTVEDLRGDAPATVKPVVLPTERPAPAARPLAPVIAMATRNSNPSVAAAPRAAAPATGHAAITTPLSVRSSSSALPVGERLAPRMMGGAVVAPSLRMVAAAPAPRPAVAAFAPVAAPKVAPVTVVRPGETLSGVSKRTGVAVAELVRLNNLRPGGMSAGRSLVVPRSGAFDVAFNGVQIAFDVQPRIENGMRLAPFRQIFEYTGGRLYWFGGEAQTVRAVNDTREVEIRIGNPEALVNNQLLKMERKPFIDSGRTIVPLSFIRDALDVKVSFDAKSGRLLIDSK